MIPHSRATDPQTSREAGLRVDLNARCREVLLAICDAGKLRFTDGDIAQFMREDRNIVARRRGDLVEAGHVEPVLHLDGTQMTTLGRRNRQELLWCVSDRGYEAAYDIKRSTT